jgi:hypothetical protein
MAKGGGQVKETSKERALADIGKQQLADFKQRWLPVQQKFAAQVTAAGGPDSFERRRATTMAGVDTSAKYGLAQQKLDQSAAAGGAFGSASHKLGVVGMGQDRATSAGLGAVAADQATDDQSIAGLNAVTALGRGEKATALGGMQQAAAISARQAQADADRSLQERAGNYQLAGSVVGLGTGLMAGQKPSGVRPEDLAAANATDDPIGALNSIKGWT